jgi:Cu(I)/Ag(I) efflux system protein CusF
MKFITSTLSLVVALSVSTFAIAQSGGMGGMDMKDMDMQKCMDMKGMKGMDMKDMDPQKCKEMMQGMDMKDMDKKADGKASKATVHKTAGVVKAVDPSKGTVTLAHEPVKSLNWPAMTMSFAVKDKMLFDKLAVDKKVNVEFKQDGAGYVVTSVR